VAVVDADDAALHVPQHGLGDLVRAAHAASSVRTVRRRSCGDQCVTGSRGRSFFVFVLQ
jgi:hypothetical protein